jgi:hypothetical protein
MEPSFSLSLEIELLLRGQAFVKLRLLSLDTDHLCKTLSLKIGSRLDGSNSNLAAKNVIIPRFVLEP